MRSAIVASRMEPDDEIPDDVTLDDLQLILDVVQMELREAEASLLSERVRP